MSKFQHAGKQQTQEQAPSVQRELISNFNPPAGTKNVTQPCLGCLMLVITRKHGTLCMAYCLWSQVAGRMTAFLNMILNKTRQNLARAGECFLGAVC